MAKTGKTNRTISDAQWKNLRDQGMTGQEIHAAVANGSLTGQNANSYKYTPGGNGGGNGSFVYGSTDPTQQGVQTPAQTGGTPQASANDVSQSFINGAWAKPNNSYIDSGAFLNNENIDPRAGSAMAAFRRQGVDLDAIKSNLNQYTGLDENASNQDLANFYLYNNLRGMSPDQSSQALQNIQDNYDAKGIGADVFAAYNNAVLGDGTGNNGLAATQTANETKAPQGEYQLSNSAQRAQATAQRDYLQSTLDSYESEVEKKVRAENPNATDYEIAIKVGEAMTMDKQDPNSDYNKAKASIDQLNGTIRDLSTAIDQETAAGEKQSSDYRADFISDNYMPTAQQFIASSPQNKEVARRIGAQVMTERYGMSPEAANQWADQWINSAYTDKLNPNAKMPPEVALAIAEYVNDREKDKAALAELSDWRNSLVNKQFYEDVAQNRFNTPQSVDKPWFNYQPKF